MASSDESVHFVGKPSGRGSLRGYFEEGGFSVRGSFEWSKEEAAQDGGVFSLFDRRGGRSGRKERRGSFFSEREGKSSHKPSGCAFLFHDRLGVFDLQVVPHYAVEEGVFYPKFHGYL
ncbi:UNVERIFIED_CONTAM: hypothetical protein Sradi_4381900 [Sesamum radiatum]|uniref:Uncharacterized protein n=1 Tax=Sesamum radiatum TaxID=300843 RepID=A0AAW2NSL4_SESRA